MNLGSTDVHVRTCSRVSIHGRLSLDLYAGLTEHILSRLSNRSGVLVKTVISMPTFSIIKEVVHGSHT